MSGRKQGCTAEVCCHGLTSDGLPDTLICTNKGEAMTDTTRENAQRVANDLSAPTVSHYQVSEDGEPYETVKKTRPADPLRVEAAALLLALVEERDAERADHDRTANNLGLMLTRAEKAEADLATKESKNIYLQERLNYAHKQEAEHMEKLAARDAELARVQDECDQWSTAANHFEADLAALKMIAEAMAITLDQWARIDESKCAALDAYDAWKEGQR